MLTAQTPDHAALKAELSRRILSECLHEDVDRTLTSASGSPLKWCFDLRPLLLDGPSLAQVANHFWDRLGWSGPFQVCGLELSAVPLLTAIVLGGQARGRPVNGLVIRKERKGYGTRKRIEGLITQDPIFVVDDLINSGSSLERVCAALGEVGRDIAGAFALLDFQTHRQLEWRARCGIPVASLFTLNDFRDDLPSRASKAESLPPATSATIRPKDFRLVGVIPEISEIAKEAGDAEELWSVDPSRQRSISVQRETEAITLQKLAVKSMKGHDKGEAAPTEAARRFPTTMDVLDQIAESLGGRLQKVMIVRLRPEGRVYPHTDVGDYYRHRDRYHLVVASPEGSSLTCAEQSIEPAAGEVWWLNNKRPHSAHNPGDCWRVHVIFDLLPTWK